MTPSFRTRLIEALEAERHYSNNAQGTRPQAFDETDMAHNKMIDKATEIVTRIFDAGLTAEELEEVASSLFKSFEEMAKRCNWKMSSIEPTDSDRELAQAAARAILG